MSAYLLVRSGQALYGVPLTAVVEVLDTKEVMAVPRTHQAVRGVCPVRGRLLPRIHLDAFIRGGSSPPEPSPTLVVAKEGTSLVGLEVDEVDLTAQSDLLPLPAEWQSPCALGVTRSGANLVPILDMSSLLARLCAVPEPRP